MKKSVVKKLYGLVLVGGKSTRMKTDKAFLEFHGKIQSVYCYELLSEYCEKVFMSNRKDQREDTGQKGFPQIHDQEPFLGIGPLGGILSAMTTYPDVSWIVLACDLPFVTEKTIHWLIDNRDPAKQATAYQSTHDGLPEPLCAIYESHALKDLLAYFQNQKTCPRKFLINSNVELLKQTDTISLDNINNPEEYRNALKILKKTPQ